MSITLKQVNKKSADYKKIKELYKKAFPVNERAPFFVLSSKAKKPNVDFWGIYSDKKYFCRLNSLMKKPRITISE